MGETPADVLTWRTALRLGRVANLPTVWSNGIAGFAIAGGEISSVALAPLLFALSLLYAGGMYLNDALDAESDRLTRPERPIPSGLADQGTVLKLGFLLLGLGVLVLGLVGYGITGGAGVGLAVAGVGLAGMILLYNYTHRTSSLAPVYMGLCRFLVYLVAALAATDAMPWNVMALAAITLFYVTVITVLSRRESANAAHYPEGFIALLIAAIAILDAFYLAGFGLERLALLSVGLFALTLYLQRLSPGT